MEFVGKPGNFYELNCVAMQSKFKNLILEFDIEKIFEKYGIKNINCIYNQNCCNITDTSLRGIKYYRSIIRFDLKYGKVEIIINDFVDAFNISKPEIKIENIDKYDDNLYNEVCKFANDVRDLLPFYKGYLMW